MLWLLDLMIANVRSRQRVHMSEKCVAMIKSIIEKREFLINQIGTSVKERFVPYKVVVPLSVRVFYREIGGKYLISAPTDEQVFRPYLYVLTNVCSRSSSGLLLRGRSTAVRQCTEPLTLCISTKEKKALFSEYFEYC